METNELSRDGGEWRGAAIADSFGSVAVVGCGDKGRPKWTPVLQIGGELRLEDHVVCGKVPEEDHGEVFTLVAGAVVEECVTDGGGCIGVRNGIAGAGGMFKKCGQPVAIAVNIGVAAEGRCGVGGPGGSASADTRTPAERVAVSVGLPAKVFSSTRGASAYSATR